MKLKQVKLQNFRGFKDQAVIDLDEMTVFVGKNDVGKSTILDALDIFFNKTAPDLDDACVFGDKKNVRIGCVFDNFPKELIIDSSNKTSLEKEFLLNANGLLEIHKVYDCSGVKPKLIAVLTRANHPTADGFGDLLSLTIAKLKDRAKKLNVNLSKTDQTKSAAIRSTIWSSSSSLALAEVDVSLADEAGKIVWEELEKYLPLYALFKSDRQSTDQDAEAQDPMRLAIQEAIKGQQIQLQNLEEEIKKQIVVVAQKTVEKIRELSPELAGKLMPRITTKKWDTLFGVSLTGEGEIPVNKRGSGVRRLILISFFRAQAEQAASKESRVNIIYAIEEPEASQHPNNQKILLDSFHDLIEAQNCQIILTTHTPVLARHVDYRHLRYVTQDANQPCIVPCDEEVLAEIQKTLGVLPDHNVKVFFGVEGRHDISFLKNISRNLHREDNSIPDLDEAEVSGKLVFIPLGGSCLDLWVGRINGLNRPQFYLMDRCSKPPARAKYQDHYERLIVQKDTTAWITSKMELENYIPLHVIKNEFSNYEGNGNAFEDAPRLLAKAIHTADAKSNPWEEVEKDLELAKKKDGNAKKRLNNDVVSKITLDMLKTHDPDEELISWLKSIGKALENGTQKQPKDEREVMEVS